MIFGILKDIKDGEYRVICTPVEVKSIIAAGHRVYAQHNCGKMAGFPDEMIKATVNGRQFLCSLFIKC